MKNFAVLKTDSPWFAFFPNGLAPIVNIIIPRVGDMIGGGGPQEFYDLDLVSLDPERRERICQKIADDAGVTVADVKIGIRDQGTLPLRAIHVSSVSTDAPWFL
jgi:hypothetical protein